ncbi:MAG: L-rhamnose mutarotase [Chitinophagaceae bacterium]|jgi:L-rhamnose mutarotase|nr:L-rhamnose mutarotase [Chitinophagaceae bacterium]
MQKYILALDLKDDAQLIREYEACHKNIWQDIEKSIRNSGIENLEIYRVGNRLMMLMETNDSFSFEAKAKADAENPKVQEWETWMWKFQQALPWAKEGEKWMLMERIYEL